MSFSVSESPSHNKVTFRGKKMHKVASDGRSFNDSTSYRKARQYLRTSYARRLAESPKDTALSALGMMTSSREGRPSNLGQFKGKGDEQSSTTSNNNEGLYSVAKDRSQSSSPTRQVVNGSALTGKRVVRNLRSASPVQIAFNEEKDTFSGVGANPNRRSATSMWASEIPLASRPSSALSYPMEPTDMSTDPPRASYSHQNYSGDISSSFSSSSKSSADYHSSSSQRGGWEMTPLPGKNHQPVLTMGNTYSSSRGMEWVHAWGDALTVSSGNSVKASGLGRSPPVPSVSEFPTGSVSLPPRSHSSLSTMNDMYHPSNKINRRSVDHISQSLRPTFYAADFFGQKRKTYSR